jgi:hypothetical protein
MHASFLQAEDQSLPVWGEGCTVVSTSSWPLTAGLHKVNADEDVGVPGREMSVPGSAGVLAGTKIQVVDYIHQNPVKAGRWPWA